MPLIYHHPSTFSPTPQSIPAERTALRYDYLRDTYGTKTHDTNINVVESVSKPNTANDGNINSTILDWKPPKLGIFGNRNSGEMKLLDTVILNPNQRHKSNYKENIFESREVGLGSALEEENERKQKERKRKQVCSLRSGY